MQVRLKTTSVKCGQYLNERECAVYLKDNWRKLTILGPVMTYSEIISAK